ncbi:MAG: cysteine--tRNA ligase [archaeon]|nr:cysteine--tRNA ligase [archaeon]
MLKLYNTLTHKKEVFRPIKESGVSMYSCGPTVYNYAHIGNLRTYIFNDLLRRSLKYLGFKVTQVMNITDIDDKTIKGSQKENIPLKEFTKKYERIFFNDLKELNIIKPSHILRATESIQEMIFFIETLIKKGYAYKASEGIYFSISKSKNYGKLAQLEKSKNKKARIKSDEYDKSNPQDFALWKFYTEEDGNIFWEAPFGRGRPGWHIECSAMSMKIFGPQIDIHTGAIDLIFPHHTNEIAQSEAITGKKFVNYWIHAGFLTMKEGKMSKSLGNILTLENLNNGGFFPLDYRYLCLLTHYRSSLVFSLENLKAAKNAYERIKRKIIELKAKKIKGKDLTKEYKDKFKKAIDDDLSVPKAVQIFIDALDNQQFDSLKKLRLLEKFDEVLGLNIEEMKEEDVIISKEVINLMSERETARKNKDFKTADKIRDKIKSLGYSLEDSPDGVKAKKI